MKNLIQLFGIPLLVLMLVAGYTGTTGLGVKKGNGNTKTENTAATEQKEFDSESKLGPCQLCGCSAFYSGLSDEPDEPCEDCGHSARAHREEEAIF